MADSEVLGARGAGGANGEVAACATGAGVLSTATWVRDACDPNGTGGVSVALAASIACSEYSAFGAFATVSAFWLFPFCRILGERDHLRSPRAQIDQPGNRGNRRCQRTKNDFRSCVPGSVQHVTNALEEVGLISRRPCGQNAASPNCREFCHFR